jgi:hypothetical protein
MERLLNLQTLSKPTQKKIRDAVGVKNVNQLIKLAKDNGVDLGKKKETQIKRAYEYFGEIENALIEERNKQKKVKKVKKVINKNIVIDVTRNEPLENNELELFHYKMSEKCKKLIGKSNVYLQFTCKNPEKYKYSNNDFGAILGSALTGQNIISVNLGDDEIYWLNETIENGINQIINIKEKNGGSIWWDIFKKYLSFNGSETINALEYMNFRLVIMIADKIPSQQMQQSFRDGATHCVIEPLYNLWSKYAENAESKASKIRCIQQANKIKKLEEIYPLGVPEDKMEEVAKIAQRCIIMHNIVSNEIKRFNTKSSKYFHYTNTRKNHLDVGYITMDKDYESVSKEEIKKLGDKILNNTEWGLINGLCDDPNIVRNINGAYAVFNDKYEIYKNFNNSININNYSINAVKNKLLNDFIKEGRIINSEPVALCNEPNNLKDVKQADLSKAYTQHHNCAYYHGFLGKIHHFVKGNFTIDFIKKNVGMYQFLVIENNNKLFNKLGIHSNKIYTLPSPEILMMIDNDVKVHILGGAFGSTFDFEYNDELLKDGNYATWAGKLGMDNEYDTYNFKGDAEWASHLKYELGEDKVNYWSARGIITIKVKKLSYSTKHHIYAFITAYTRINMIHLMNNIDGELVKVILDGVYYRGTLNEVKVDYKDDKELKEHFHYGEGWYKESTFNINQLSEFDERFNGNCILAGAGGTGKSHSVFNYGGFNDVLYVVPTNELGFGSNKKFTTIHRLIGIECASYRSMYRLPSVIFIDELTMIEKEWIEKAIVMYPECLILIGGDIDKNQWYQCRSGYPGHFSKLWMGNNWRFVFYENDYRALDNELKQMKTNIRNVMKKVFTDGDMMDTLKVKQYILNNYKCIDFDDAIKQHVEGNMWIVGTHKTKDKLKKSNIECEFNDKKQNGFTIHSFQGLTITDRKVFIKLDMFEYAMYYTAISRVRNFNQIVFVK